MQKFILIIFFISVSLLFATNFAGGTGTKDDPYQVSTAEELNSIRGYLNDTVYFIQIATIDLGVAPWNTGDGWEPIGSNTNTTHFRGTYDGATYSVKNIFIKRDTENVIGLFGFVGTDGVLKNIRLEGGTVSGRDTIGGLIGINYKGNITDCYVTASVTGTGIGIVGGLIGENNQGQLSQCYSSGVTSGKDIVGGLVGYSSWGSIENCYTTGTVTGTGNTTIGGLIGISSDNSIANCNTSCSVTATSCNNVGGLIGINSNSSTTKCYTTGDISGKDIVGGLIGVANGSGVPTEFSNCFTTGSVSGTNQIGGIAGIITSNLVLTNSYSTAVINGTERVGGIVGDPTHSSLNNCYASGLVSGTAFTGGLSGKLNELFQTNASYWDNQTTNQKYSPGTDSSFGKTTLEMKQQSTYIDWDFSTTWTINATLNDGYPVLTFATDKQNQTLSFTLGANSTKTYTDAPFSLVATATSGLAVSFTSSDPSVATVSGSTVTLLKAGTTTLTAHQPGNSSYYPAASVSQLLTVNKKSVAITGVTVSDKVYDGTTTASLSGGSLTGIAPADEVTIVSGTGTFSDKNAGLAKPVTAAGYVLAGADVDNYNLTQPTGLTATITPAPLTITAQDGEKEINQPEPVFIVTYSTFVSGDDPSVISGLTVTREPGDTLGTYIITPSGASAANYSISFVTGIFTIKEITAIIEEFPVSDSKLKPGIYVSRNPVLRSSGEVRLFVVTKNSGTVKLAIFDAQGSVLFQSRTANNHYGQTEKIIWNLQNKNGSIVSSGTYKIVAWVQDNQTKNEYVFSVLLGIKR